MTIPLKGNEPLPVGAVIGAARSDLARRVHNTEGPPYEPYAFDRRDVRKAETISELLESALNRARREADATERRSRKRSVEILYSHPATLESALAASMSEVT